MRAALLSNRQQESAGTSRVVSVPAAVRGWNTRDPLAQMKPLYAQILDNLFPTEGQVELRGGCEAWATSSAGIIRTLISFQPSSGSEKLLAVSDTGFYDATAGGAMGATIKALTDGHFESVIITNSAGTQYLWGCNGVDDVVVYDGTTFTSLNAGSTPAITGVNTNTLNWCWAFKRRIFAVQEGSMNAWYGPIDSIAGPFAVMPLGAVFHRGGYLLSGASWTMDGGLGPDDYCVFITSEGEVAVYKGINPASAASWELVGTYFVGRPPSRRCVVQYGADLIITTEFGGISLSRLLQSGLLSVDKALTDAIRPTFAAAVRDYRANDGWQSLIYPTRNALIVNVPTTSTVSSQFVMNTITGAWCAFSGWNAKCFTVHEGVLYFGIAGGTVVRAWDGVISGDYGNDITATHFSAYNKFGSGGLKQVKLVRPLLTSDSGVQLSFGVSADYDPPVATSVIPRGSASSYSYWDVALWNVSFWSLPPIRQKRWYHVSSETGFALAFFLQAATNTAVVVTLSSLDFELSFSQGL